MSDDDIKPSPACHAAAELAVKKTFAILGIDVDKPEMVESFREDLRFGRKLRRASDQGILALVSVLVAALVGTLWYGIQSKLGYFPADIGRGK